MVNIRYYLKFFRCHTQRNNNTIISDEEIDNHNQYQFVNSIANHNLVQFVYTPIPQVKENQNQQELFKFLMTRIDTPKHRMYTITCQTTGKIIFYLIKKVCLFKMKENYEIYLNYTPLKCPFIVKDLMKIIEHYSEHGFNEEPENGILIGNIYCNPNKSELILKNAKLLRKHTKQNIKYSAVHDIYKPPQNNTKLSWKEWINYQSAGIIKTTVETNIIDLSPPTTKIDKDISEVYILNNEKPVWNETMQSYVLNFKGRAKMASTKNTIFLDNNDARIGLFGKVRKDVYALDIGHPLSLIQGICLGITCMGKI